MRGLKQWAIAGVLATCISMAGGTPQVASAQSGLDVAAPVFDAAVKRQAITAAVKLLTEDYVFADRGAQAAALLTQHLAAGAYDADATPGAFASHLTKDLQSVAHDKHLRVFADGVVPDDLPPGPPPEIGLYGYAQADRLKGNIGYIVLNGFMPKDMSRRGADKAISLLASTDALIIDLRHNGGGDPAAVSYLVSFFFDGNTPVHVNDLLWRKPGTTDYDRSVFSTEPTPISYLGKPVYLITSHWTFSGGEEFAYDMQTLKRATLIGDVTGGGANPGGGHPIAPGFDMFLPTGRAENPITHDNWEGKGVQPDVAVPADQGFATAYSAALKALGRPVTAAPAAAGAVTETHLLQPPRTTPAPGSEAALHDLLAGKAEGHPMLQHVLPQLGALKSLTFVEVNLMGNDIYNAKFANGALNLTVGLDAEGKIESFFFRPE